MDDKTVNLRMVITSARTNIELQSVYARLHTCSLGRCYEVGLKDTLRRKRREDKACPAHNGVRCSPITQLATILYSLDGFQAVVWDCHCVPGRSDMHIDACVLCGQRWYRLEVDGAHHFEHDDTKRQKNDEIKDELMNTAKLGMLRLHHKDKDQWAKYVQWMLGKTLTQVKYTASYHDCLDGLAEHGHIVTL